MRTITRKTNVRRHDRHLPSKVADVRKHQRTVTRQMLGTIPIKDLTYPQAKRRFPWINPNADYDGDMVVNKKDCRPFDEERQDDPYKNPNKKEWRKCDECGYTFYASPYSRCPRCRREFDEYFKAESRARKASPLGDYDGDGVCNKDDCHPLDPNRQDARMKNQFNDEFDEWHYDDNEEPSSEFMKLAEKEEQNKFSSIHAKRIGKYLEKTRKGELKEEDVDLMEKQIKEEDERKQRSLAYISSLEMREREKERRDSEHMKEILDGTYMELAAPVEEEEN